MNLKTYSAGIDVGTNSVGLAAIELDEKDHPIRILNSVVFIHDSGVDPEQAEDAVTRLASSGVARRTRRLVRRRRRRLEALDKKISEWGWPIVDHGEFADPYMPWKIRAQLATEKLAGDTQQVALSVAIRHIARHRGWRNPYQRIETLHRKAEPSEFFENLKQSVTEISGVVFSGGETPAQVVVEAGLSPAVRLRTNREKQGGIGGKLLQSDNATEILKIAEVQGLDREFANQIIDLVFASESPKGKQKSRVKKDELPGQGKYPRALKAHLEFQRYRIITVVANLRIRDAEQGRRTLTAAEKNQVIDFLMDSGVDDGITWSDVAEVLGIARTDLLGTAKEGPDGERASSFPPVNVTNTRILKSEIEPLMAWWKSATPEEQNAMILALSNAEELSDDEPGAEAVKEFLADASDEVLEKLDAVKLPLGRAAYSVESLVRLNERMLADSVDLHEARKLEFGVSDDWAPSADPIGEPVGNPAVDRVLKIVARWLQAAESQWGAPVRVNIEHVRDGFSSKRLVREYESDLKKRAKRNRKVVAEANSRWGITDMRRSDITRYLAVRRQNCECAYCGDPITYQTCEMDHIVPRKGPGSTNSRANLVATCVRCNRAKSNIPFAVWAARADIPGVSVAEAVQRVRSWIDDDGLTRIQNRNFKKDVIERLVRTSEDEAIDSRSIESVAWMARELAHRVKSHYGQLGADTKVGVFRGFITSEARKASGLESKIQFIGGPGKTRLDRRHHALDAAVVALMRQKAAQVLVERSEIRSSEQVRRVRPTWKDYRGDSAENRVRFGEWLNTMNKLEVLFNQALLNDEIPVMENIRLRLGNGAAHKATISPTVDKRLGDAWSLAEIDRALYPQLWVALTKAPDFDAKLGLPANPSREIRVKNTWYKADDLLPILPKQVAAIPVREGYALVGNSIHHARIYRINGKKPSYGMVRVFAHDLLPYRAEDLFAVELPPQSISMRNANSKVRKAILNGSAEYRGWLVYRNELEMDLSSESLKSGGVGKFLEDFPGTKRWVVVGFEDSSRINVRPRLLAREGLPTVDVSEETKKVFGNKGLRLSVDKLFTNVAVRKVQRDALGRERLSSANGLPISQKFS
ncbi:MAG: HNH endonuclease [Trueperella sp.]|nr:HNH endonuclease [Trueperella sp.]